MIVRQFLKWVQTASPGDRAEATSALARAYLYSELAREDRLAAEAAMTVLLDDPSPLVRRALADALGGAEAAPHGIVIALAYDQPDIAEIVAGRSPVLGEAELVDLVGNGVGRVQAAIAARESVSRAVAGAIAEVAAAAACLVLIENPCAELAPRALARMAERHGHLSAVREALLAREDLPAETRQALIAKLADTLARFVAHREWLPEERARRIAREACDRATVVIAADSRAEEVAALVRHLVESDQLTSMLLLRVLLAGNRHFLIEALAELSGVKSARVAAILSDRNGHGFRALYDRAGLPQGAFRVFRTAHEVMHELGGSECGLRVMPVGRSLIERVLARYTGEADGELDYLLALLRRFAAEAAREEARYYTADLVAAA